MSGYDSIIRGLDQAIGYIDGTVKARRAKVTIKAMPTFSNEEIKEIRLKTGFSQAIFARAMGVSPKTIEAWECGRNIPNGPSRRLLQMFKENPDSTKQFVVSID